MVGGVEVLMGECAESGDEGVRRSCVWQAELVGLLFEAAGVG